MRVNIKKVKDICEKILVENGIKIKDASIIVDDYLEGELLGKKSHGLLALIRLALRYLLQNCQ